MQCPTSSAYYLYSHVPSLFQLCSVVMAVSGIVLFAYEDGFQSASIVGVVLSVGAAIGAAAYKVCNFSLHDPDF